jgi:hypothetical protein
MLHVIGIERGRIFYSSAHGYGMGLGQNFIQRLKEELSGEVLVIFLMSDNFFDSTMCMCEMGATWVMTKEHVPILIPPFDFNKVKGVFPNTQGMKISDRMAFTELAELLMEYFGMEPFKHLHWERDRNRICDRIDELLAAKS